MTARFSRIAFWSCFALSIIVIGLVYKPALDLFFVQDDFVFLARLAQISSFTEWLELFTRADQFLRPMSRVGVLSVPFFLFGKSPAGYHAFNIGLHCLNATLVYALLRLLKLRPLSSLCGLIIYGVYPAHGLAVVWISGVQELGLALFSLLTVVTFILHLRARSQGSQALSILFLACSLLGYAFALLSKESALLLPVCLLYIGYINPQPDANLRSRRPTAYLAPVVGFAVIAIGYLMLRMGIATGSDAYIFNFGPVNIMRNLRLYLYDALIGASLDLFGTVLAVITIVILVLALALNRRTRHNTILGILWVFCFLAPVLPLENRHYSYYFSLSTVGVIIAICTGIDDAIGKVTARRWPYASLAALTAGILAVALFSARTIQRDLDTDVSGIKLKGARAEQIITHLRREQPQFPSFSRLYVHSSRRENLVDWITGFGTLFGFYYPNLTQVILVTDGGVYFYSPSTDFMRFAPTAPAFEAFEDLPLFIYDIAAPKVTRRLKIPQTE